MHGGEADVFVAASVAGHEMRIEHLVVVGQRIAVVGHTVGRIDLAVEIDVRKVSEIDAAVVIRILDEGGSGIEVGLVTSAVAIDIEKIVVGDLLELRRCGIMVVIHEDRLSVMGDVVQEGVVGADRSRRRDSCSGAFLEPVGGVGGVRCHDDLRVAVLTRNEAAVLVGLEKRHIVDVEVVEPDAEHLQCLRLHLRPAADRTVERPVGGFAVEEATRRCCVA
ncbi:hypothetical protein AIGOOFII_1798 [Methylobacterium marchantiae]|nr:hypothetical protein AIGOOFII_1798 [Methylobacterium marchantiae]